MYLFMKYQRAFSLIELLVVISIIALLSSVVLSSLNVARSKARDARRLSDMKQVQTALELYKSTYDTYPNMDGTGIRQNSCFDNGNGGTAVGQWERALTPLVTEKLLPELPRDPLNNSIISSANPFNCYTYNRNLSNFSYYEACRNVETGTAEFLGNYEYILYYSLENRPMSRGYIQWWGANAASNDNNSSNRPHYGCMFGPRK